MCLQVFPDILRLCHDIARDEAVGNLETLRQRVVEHPAAQFIQQLCLRLVGERFHIFHVRLAIFVERGRQCLVHIVGVGNLVHVVRHGMVKDVGLDRLAVGVTLQGEDFPVIGIHAEQVDVLLVVQVAELTDKAVVQPVQARTQFPVLLPVFRFVVVQAVVGVAKFNVGCGTLLLAGGQFQRMEHGDSLIHAGEVADLPVHIHQ